MRWVALVVLCFACGPAANAPVDGGAKPVVVFAAASLTEAFKALSAHDGFVWTYNFAGSPTLVTQIENGAQGTFFVESSYPHRIVRWEWNPPVGSGRWGADSNDSGELGGSARLKYWELHDEGGERYLARLGLNAGSR